MNPLAQHCSQDDVDDFQIIGGEVDNLGGSPKMKGLEELSMIQPKPQRSRIRFNSFKEIDGNDNNQKDY